MKKTLKKYTINGLESFSSSINSIYDFIYDTDTMWKFTPYILKLTNAIQLDISGIDIYKEESESIVMANRTFILQDSIEKQITVNGKNFGCIFANLM